jgi:hypothetical protein
MGNGWPTVDVNHLIILASAALAACQGMRSIGTQQPGVPPAPDVAPSPSVPDTAAPPVAPSPPLTLSVVVEGRCPELGVSFLDNATLVHYGHVPGSSDAGAARLVLAFLRDDGTLDEDPKLGRGLMHRELDMTASAALDVESIGGSWPERVTLSLRGEGGERVGSFSEERAWRGDHWEDAPRVARETPSTRWLNGSKLERDYNAYLAYSVVPPGAAPAPDFTSMRVKGAGPDCVFGETALLARPTGELFLAGTFCGFFPTHGVLSDMGPRPTGEAGVARWVPGGKAKLEKIPDVARHADLVLVDFVEASPTTLFLFGTVANPADAQKPDAYLALHDGTSWSRVETPYHGSVTHHEVAPDGALWVLADHALFERKVDGAWNKLPLEDVASVVWANGRPSWVALRRALARRGDDGQWTRISAPRPAFSSSSELDLGSLSISPKGEVWIHASYEEKRPEWTKPERREALLRAGVAYPAAHCDVAMGSSFSSWPPPATAGCAHPVAILARVSKSAPAQYDFPQTRAALRGHTEILGAEFVEIDIDGKRLLAAKVESIEMGKRLVEIVSQGVAGTRPELVCSEPKVTRTIPFDLGTGALKAGRTANAR